MSQKELENIKLLKEYKELLDMGAISQQEYDAKKDTLLNDKFSSSEIQNNAVKKPEITPETTHPKKRKRMGCLIWVIVILLCFVSCVAIFSERSEKSDSELQ